MTKIYFKPYKTTPKIPWNIKLTIAEFQQGFWSWIKTHGSWFIARISKSQRVYGTFSYTKHFIKVELGTNVVRKSSLLTH